MKSKRGEVKREVSFTGKKLYSREGANDKKLLDSFYNKSLANLMRLDQSSFEESEESPLSQAVGLDDMVDMERMEEELVLQNLKDRYQSKIIYVGNLILFGCFLGETHTLRTDVYWRYFGGLKSFRKFKYLQQSSCQTFHGQRFLFPATSHLLYRRASLHKYEK